MRLSSAFLLASLVLAWGGEFRKSYFGATKPGGWSEYLLSSGQDSKSTFRYQRRPNDAGRIVLQLSVNILSGPGQGKASQNTYFMPRGFNLERDGLSFGKFIEKMSMSARGMEMTVDEATLDQIRRAEKDFREAVTFEASENVDGRLCDRYAYSLQTGGPAPTNEKGKLWLSDSVPFAVVRQLAEVFRPNGTKISGFEMRLHESGFDRSLAEAPARSTVTSKPEAPPLSVTLQDAYQTGKITVEVAVVEGSAGRRLSLTLANKADTPLAVTVRGGPTDLKAGAPLHRLRFTSPEPPPLQLPANGRGASLVVEQRGNRGLVDGKCALSVDGRKFLFSGSVRVGPLPK